MFVPKLFFNLTCGRSQCDQIGTRVRRRPIFWTVSLQQKIRQSDYLSAFSEVRNQFKCLLWLVCVIVNWLECDKGIKHNTLVPCVDPCPGRININKRRKYTNTKFIRVLSAAHLIHQSIWIALRILTLPGDGRKTSVEAQSIQWLKWNLASTTPPLGFSIRAIMHLKYIQVQQGKNFHISSREPVLFKSTTFEKKLCWKELREPRGLWLQWHEWSEGLLKRKCYTCACAVNRELGQATLRPVLLPLSVQHEAFYLMWDNMTTVKASVKEKTKSWQPWLLSRGDMPWSKERLGTYKLEQGQREASNSATRHDTQQPPWLPREMGIHKLREKTRKCNSSTIKWYHLQFKWNQQLIRICDFSRLEIQTNATESKCEITGCRNTACQNIFPPPFFSLLFTCPCYTRSISLNEMQHAITHHPVNWSRHLTICAALGSANYLSGLSVGSQ